MADETNILIQAFLQKNFEQLAKPVMDLLGEASLDEPALKDMLREIFRASLLMDETLEHTTIDEISRPEVQCIVQDFVMKRDYFVAEYNDFSPDTNTVEDTIQDALDAAANEYAAFKKTKLGDVRDAGKDRDEKPER